MKDANWTSGAQRTDCQNRIERLRKDLKFSIEELAARITEQTGGVIAVNYDSLRRCLHGRQRWPEGFLDAVAACLGTTAGQLRGEAQAGSMWQSWTPGTDDLQVLVDFFAEHQKGGIESQMVEIPCSWMTPGVTIQHYHSKLGGFLLNDRTAAIIEQFVTFADLRREAWLHSGHGRVMTIPYMLQSQFERLIERRPPFETCTNREVLHWLEYFRAECVEKRDAYVVLLDDARLPRDLLFDYYTFNCSAVLGDSAVVRRWEHGVVEMTVDKAIVRRTAERTRHLGRFAAIEPTHAAFRKQIEVYLRRVERVIKHQVDE